MLGWHMGHEQVEDVGAPKYDSGEIPRNHIPLLTHSQGLSGELPMSSPDHMMSPGGGGKRVHPLPYRSRRGGGDIDATTDYNMDDALLYDREGEPSELAAVDIFVSTVDPLKEPPLVTANTVLSILAVDYPVDKVSCYVSDDGAAMLTFEALAETSEFARKWVPFCKKYNIEPRAPEWYFSRKIDYLKDKVQPSFVKDRRAMKISNIASIWFISLFLSIFATGILEMRWSGVGIDEWWRNEQFWVIGGVSAHLFAVFQGLLKVLAGIDTNFTVTSKASDEDGDFAELYMFKWTTLLIPPTTLLIVNLVGVVAGISYAINSGYQSWGPLFGKLFFAFWVIVHLYPFLKGLMGRQNRTPTIVVVWSILLASIFSLLWVRVDPFTTRVTGPDVQQCGINC
ncbi:hypothetical protein BHE74_00041896 [Ensete ventricosum]|nr:hypothetical protein GW17_00021389 [Ensete ventricosum]RWW51735.1 hypothetical protein BHE74_00041896 [Ensete ventricosum]RZR94485.1 hypothetical protein BHM03_00023179 [Ensete ventricosum]